ncbi:hypothetical protein F0U47_18915 [Nocardioides antri]|uniref:Uncharacterized protein n=1 Tax=Nocardioides antri TaxID=2607659 RepID=A0A5B1LUW3_9ACTN|nr:hypothetical protein F0U47_18915 [Nocardioides antri]
MRLLNVVLAVVVLVLGMQKGVRLWNHLNTPGRLFYTSFLGLIAAIQYGTAENLALDTERGLRVYLTTGALAVALAGPRSSLDDLLAADRQANSAMMTAAITVPTTVTTSGRTM